ncbi:MAG: Gx transporter family protein [Oscillospiraceae bacterium]|nr:Gx transporter family protein [Oscillospiraceae bacterium]
MLIALALALSYTERFIPLQMIFPLPGIKLGLANIVTLVALYLLKTRHAFMILIPRCVFGALFGGGITALMFSLCGGILALSVMAFAKKIPAFSIYGVSILGAAAHNVGQILAAMVLMRSIFIGAYLPYLLLIAILTGFLTGSISAGILRAVPYAHISLPAEMSK